MREVVFCSTLSFDGEPFYEAFWDVSFHCRYININCCCGLNIKPVNGKRNNLTLLVVSLYNTYLNKALCFFVGVGGRAMPKEFV